MIYITGDCHHDFRKFNIEAFPEQREMTKDDYVIICGDFGGVWVRDEESTEEKWWLDWLEERSFTTLFVDGNHENFDALGYPFPYQNLDQFCNNLPYCTCDWMVIRKSVSYK